MRLLISLSGTDDAIKKRGIVKENGESIGYCEADGKWYGWSHRAIYGFKVGSKCTKKDAHYTPEKGEWTAKTEEDAKQMARDFAESVSSSAEDTRTKVYPNSAAGAKDALKAMMNNRWYIKLQIDKCKIHPDPHVDGVWAVDNPETRSRVIVYLAGYKESSGRVRDHNDFEEGRY